MRLHLGCGKRDFGPGWTNVDLADFPHVHHRAPIYPLPFIRDNSCSLVYCCHALAYCDRQQTPAVLAEWHRVLRPGGTLRLAVSDWDQWRRRSAREAIGPIMGRWQIEPGVWVYQRAIWDESDLAGALTDAGFYLVRRWDWREVDHGRFDDHSQSYLPHMDKERGTLMSLNLEADKP